MRPPHNVAYLEKALRALAKTDDSIVRLRRTLANVIAGQFLEGAVMRGGESLKLRYGELATRYTLDFDAARRIDEEDFIESYNARISAGWSFFSGRLVRKEEPSPRDIPSEYVMRPFEVKLTYKNHAWCTVDLEVSYDEVGDADECDRVALPEGVLDSFRALGLPDPAPIPLMRISHQIAQKLHGATDSLYCRAQDLVDLQLMVLREKVDYAEVNAICNRLFANRRRQSWPSEVNATEEWRIAYDLDERNPASLADHRRGSHLGERTDCKDCSGERQSQMRPSLLIKTENLAWRRLRSSE